jgi:oligoendopeptidase F
MTAPNLHSPGRHHLTLLLASSLLAEAATLTAAPAPERTTLDPRDTWDLSVMYQSQDEWDEHYRELETRIADLAGLRGTTRNNPEALRRVLTLRDTVSTQLEKLYAYAQMKHDEDMRRPAPQAVLQRAQVLATHCAQSVSWLSPELLEIPEPTLNSWLERDDLKTYRHFFDDLLRSRKHILSPREEELLAMSAQAVEASSDAFSLLTNTELRRRKVQDPDGQEIEVTDPVFYQALESKDRRFRRDCFVALHESYLDVKSTLAATLAGAVHRDWYRAKARGYGSCLEAALDAENLPAAVYHNLLETVGRHTPLLHRYAALKQRVLKVDQLHFYDLYVNLAESPDRHYPFEEARELVLEGIRPFGAEYHAIMETAFRSRWIDVHENAGKRSGAYNMGTYLAPPYILLNYKGTFGDVSTLAHELGHAMQSYFAKENQPPVYSGYPMFTAEVASTAAEIAFKRALLARTTDRIERARLVNEMLEDMRATIFRQTQFAEFDLAVHQLAERGEPLTAETLMKLGHDLYQKYYGPDFVIDPGLGVECLRIPHFYTNFYVYRYATSYCAAAALAQRIAAREPGAVDRWMRFLKTGHSQYALDMLRTAGVDMTTPRPIEDAITLFAELLGQLEQLLMPQA